jgi:Dolichyl-phosphate-mannose-protein mannosyltransferase
MSASPTPAEETEGRLSGARMPGLIATDLSVIATVLLIKLLVLALGAVAFEVIVNVRIHSILELLDVWNRWDGPHYLDIARHGYRATGENGFMLVFYPLYPWLVRLLALFIRNTLVSAFVVSALASLAAAVALARLAAIDYSQDLALGAVWFLFIFPTSYFLHTDYTESLFLALVVTSFLAARRDRWFSAGVLGALATLTHPNGILLLPALGTDALCRLWRTRRFDARWLWLCVTPAGLAAYLFLNYHVTGNPLAFMSIEKGHWFHSLVTPWRGILETVNVALAYNPRDAQMIGVQVFFYLGIGLLGTIACAVLMPTSYTVWMAANWLLFASQSWDLSTPRYMLAMFPLFILIAMLARNRYWNAAITVWSLLSMGFFASLFAAGRWTF